MTEAETAIALWVLLVAGAAIAGTALILHEFSQTKRDAETMLEHYQKMLEDNRNAEDAEQEREAKKAQKAEDSAA